MSRIHLLSGNKGLYNFVVHQATPIGNNSAGVAWSAALIASGMAHTTIPTVGNGPGQIAQSEKDAIEAGTIIEARGQYGDDGSLTGQALTDDFNLRANQTMADRLAQLADQLKWFGLTVA